jgi:hypothetical protein
MATRPPLWRAVRGAPLAVLPLLAGVALALAWPAWPALAVTPEEGQGSRLPVGEGERFGLTFVHSHDHLPVEDWYHVSGGGIVQDATRLKQYGAGMGHVAGEGTGRDDGDWWVVDGMDRDIGELAIRVGPASVDHRLHHPGGVLPLSRCFTGQRVTVRPVTLSTFQLAAGWLRPPACEETA